MKSGLLLYDAGDDVEKVVRRAAQRYQERFSVQPDECHVNQFALDKDQTIADVRVILSPRILDKHYWIGCSAPRMPDLPLFRKI